MANVGRGVWHKKTQVEQCRALSIQELKEHIEIAQGDGGTYPYRVTSTWTRGSEVTASISLEIWPQSDITFDYVVTDVYTKEKRPCRYDVKYESTTCNFGGHRWWFRCPHCGRRCLIIYLPPGEDFFACRICHNLVYKSQQEKPSRILQRMLADVWAKALRREARMRKLRK